MHCTNILNLSSVYFSWDILLGFLLKYLVKRRQKGKGKENKGWDEEGGGGGGGLI